MDYASEEEQGGDPPRIWAPGANFPGTAFTRSLGDSGAVPTIDHASIHELLRYSAPCSNTAALPGLSMPEPCTICICRDRCQSMQLCVLPFRISMQDRPLAGLPGI